MDCLTARIPILKQDNEIITKDFLKVLKENSSQKPADGSVVKRMPLSQYARINSLEKISTVLKRSTGALESIINNSEYVEYEDICCKLAEDVEETGIRLHEFCMDHISRDKPVTVYDVSMTICDTGESSSSPYQPNEGDGQRILFSNKEYIDPSEARTTADNKALLSIDEEEEQRVTLKKKKALFKFKRLNIIKTKYFSKKNEKQENIVKSYASTSTAAPITQKVEEVQENAWIFDHSTVEKYIQVLFTHVEQLLKALKKFTTAIERKKALVTLPKRAFSTDTAGTFMKLIDMMDKEQTFSWQKANSSQSNFKRSLSFRGRNAVAVAGECTSGISSNLIDSLSMQMPLRYKRSTGEMSI